MARVVQEQVLNLMSFPPAGRAAKRLRSNNRRSVVGLPMAMDRSEAHDLTLEQIFDQIEHGEWRTMCLIQFLSREDAEVEPMAASIDESGHVKIRNGHGETTEPKSPRQLRQRMKVVAHGYVMASFKHPQKHALQKLRPEHFMTYIDFLLGDQVMGLRAKNEDGRWCSPMTIRSEKKP